MMTAHELEAEYWGRGTVRGGILMLAPDVALELVERARQEQIKVLGLDAFVLSSNATEPVSEHSLDLSAVGHQGGEASWAEASAFLRQYRDSDLSFEVVLA